MALRALSHFPSVGSATHVQPPGVVVTAARRPVILDCSGTPAAHMGISLSPRLLSSSSKHALLTRPRFRRQIDHRLQ